MTRRRVGVLTFHRCINYGSYWQARCLVEGLRARGLDAVLLDHRSAWVDRREWTNALRPTLPTPTSAEDRRSYRKKVRLFLAAIEADLPMTPPFAMDDPAAAGAFDAVVIGSDEVWNFRHPWYSGQPLFFGQGLKADRLIAYAASFGNHDAATGIGVEWAERLAGFDDLSVRDANSVQMIANALGWTAPIVADPCLLFAEAAARPKAAPTGDLVVYGHGFPDAFRDQVVAFARTENLRLVSFGYANAWADEQRIAEGPVAFAEAMGGAAAVATNFFHGCVFAAINKKPFVATLSDYRSNKVSDLLERLGMPERLMGPESSAEVFEEALSNPSTSPGLSALRHASNGFVSWALRDL